MKIFLDTAEIEEIRTAARWGVLDGVTTNPTLFAKVGGELRRRPARDLRHHPGPVSAEVVAEDVEGMLREGRHFAKLAPNIVVKVPMSEEGLEAISRFAEEGIKTNCTLIFSCQPGPARGQGRAPRCCRRSWAASTTSTRTAWRSSASWSASSRCYDLDAEVLAASIRHPRHMTEAALAGAHIATVPFKILQQMVHHPLTDKGIVQFRKDWEAARKAAEHAPATKAR